MRGLNLPTDEAIVSMAAQAGFTVGSLVQLRTGPAYISAPIRSFSWCDGQVLASWFEGAERAPLTALMLVPLSPSALKAMDRTLDSWQADWERAVAGQGFGATSLDWIPDYPPSPAEEALVQADELRDEESYSLDNQDSTEYPENPLDEQRD